MTTTKVLRPFALALFLLPFGALGCSDDGSQAQDAAVPDAAPDADLPDFPNPARVLRVIDGDTIEVRFREREITVRLLGVNTPELNPSPEPYANEARQFTIDHAPPTFTVGLEFDDPDCGVIPFPSSCFDIYDRMLAYVRTPDEEDLNALLLENGLARVFNSEDFDRKNSYLQLESQAQSQGLGIWCP